MRIRESMKHVVAVPFARTSTSGASAAFSLNQMERVGAFAWFEPSSADGYVSPDTDDPPFRSCLASLAPSIHALRDRRNPAAGPVMAATSMHAAGCALSFIYARSKAFWSFTHNVGTSTQCFAAVEHQSLWQHRYGDE